MISRYGDVKFFGILLPAVERTAQTGHKVTHVSWIIHWCWITVSLSHDITQSLRQR